MEDRAQIQTIDSAVLTPLVRRAYGNDSIEPGQWSIQQIHSGAGEGMGIYRVRGQGMDYATDYSWSLILKVLGCSDSTLDPSGWGYWRREADIYQSGFLDDLPAGLKTARCFAVSEPVEGILWLWLEDVPEAPEASWRLEDYRRVAHQLGLFNGHHLNRLSGFDYPWLSRKWLRGWVNENAEFAKLLPQSLDNPWLQRLWPGSIGEAVCQLWNERELYLDTLERLPQTLCHLDIFRRNLLARVTSGGDHETVVLDWSFAGLGALGEELVPLTLATVTFFEFDLMAGRELEEQVFEGYLRGLRESGWEGDPREVRLAYACAGALRFSLGVLRLILPTTLDEKLQPLAEQFWGRPFYELCECWGILTSRYTLRLADEARDLIDTLGY
jgi:hypothetical protein